MLAFPVTVCPDEQNFGPSRLLSNIVCYRSFVLLLVSYFFIYTVRKHRLGQW